MKLKSKIDNIKSKYILKFACNYLLQRKKLELAQYNIKIQKRLNLNINDYKIFSQTYTPIEIIIIPVKNRNSKCFNIPEKENHSYFHIYFNNNKKENKNNYITKIDKVKTIKIIIDYKVTSLSGLFKNKNYIKMIIFKKFYRNNIKDMSYMFFNCKSLKKIYFNNFNTDNVNNMEYMFAGCSSLKEINLSNFNTSNVDRLQYMFYSCSSLEELDISNFIIKNQIGLKNMFLGCSSLNQLNQPNFDFDYNNSIKITKIYISLFVISIIIIFISIYKFLK